MKEFRKSKDDQFICEKCGFLCKSKKGLSIHIRHKHNSGYKEYYDKWLKDLDEGICKICGSPTKFTGFKFYYDNGCCKKCKDIYRGRRIEEVNLKNHGFKNSYQREDVKKKIRQTCLKNHGVECYLQTSHIKKMEIDKNHDKQKKTKLERYGDENFNNTKKYKQTCLAKYGVESPIQNIRIFEKVQKNGLHSHKYKNTNINYRGSFELDFLEKYYDKFPDLKNGPTIKYIFQNKNKVYFPDFFMPSLNLIVEIKNSYLFKRDKAIIDEKKKATISSGFNYIIIINKKYSNFDSL